MILKTARRFRDRGLLGINLRNRDYVMRCNPRSCFPLVDDKLKTKSLAKKHQIPTPPLYHVIEHHGDVGRLDRVLETHSSFVVKPSRGTGGSGILLITGRAEEGFVKQDGKVFSWKDLTYHIQDILSGIYSLEGLEDRAFLEGLVHPDPVFAAVTYRGVPDVRVIVYQGVPVMAMVRLPTRASDGKANLHRGAIGVGINMSSGTTLAAVHRSGIVTDHPDTGHPVAGIQVPYWEQMLLMAAKAKEMTGLGFLGVDMVIDQALGPLLLELNARPGLQIQVANQDGLFHRLERVDKAPRALLVTPESRVDWARQTFTLS